MTIRDRVNGRVVGHNYDYVFFVSNLRANGLLIFDKIIRVLLYRCLVS